MIHLNVVNRSLNSKLYRFAVAFVSSPIGIIFLALWSFLEASFWFIAPDFLLEMYAVLKPVYKNKFFLVTLLASFVGGVFYYVLNLISFETFNQILRQTPFVTERMLAFVHQTYADHGQFGVLYQSFSFISFKIWTHTAVEMNLNPIIYFVFVMVSRVLRLYPVTWLAALGSRYLKEFIKHNFLLVLIAHLILFFALISLLEH